MRLRFEIIIIGLLFTGLNNSFGMNLRNHFKIDTCFTFTKVQLKQIDSIKNQLRDIVNVDTIYDRINDHYDIKMYNKDKKLSVSCNYSIGGAFRFYKYFDNDKNEILSEAISEREGILIEQYLYQYSNGKIITKTGYSSGEIGITLRYFYDSNWNLIDRKAYRCGKEEMNYFKTMK